MKNILRNLQGRVLIEIFALSIACLVVLPVWLPVLVGIADTGVNVLEEELSKTAIPERPELFKAPPPELEALIDLRGTRRHGSRSEFLYRGCGNRQILV